MVGLWCSPCYSPPWSEAASNPQPPPPAVSFAPITSPPTYASLSPAQRAQADTIAQLPAMVRLQGQLTGAVANMRAKVNAARARGIEPPGALLNLINQAEARSNTLKSQLAAIHDRVRDAVRDAVYRGWMTNAQAIEAGVFRAPPELSGLRGGLGIAPIVIAIAAIVVVLLASPVVIVEAINRYKMGAVAAQNANVAAAAQTNAWWASLNFAGTPDNFTGPGPQVIPGGTLPSPSTVTNNPANPNQQQGGQQDLFSKIIDKIGTVGVVAVVAGAGIFILPRLLKGRSNG